MLSSEEKAWCTMSAHHFGERSWEDAAALWHIDTDEAREIIRARWGEEWAR